MDEKEIQATMERVIDAWCNETSSVRIEMIVVEAFKLASDALVKFTRLVEAVDIIASCQIDVTEAIVDGAADATLETAQREGTC